MTGKWKPKPKKVVETSLGKAPKEAEKGPDVSHLLQPIATSVHGLKQIASLLQTATTEVQQYITFECDVLYECRVCRTIFRSLANFILHKRKYCRGKWRGGDSTEGGFVVGDDLKTSDEESRCTTPVDKGEGDGGRNGKKTILPIIDKLLKRQKVQLLAKDTLNEDLTTKADNSDDDVIFVSEENDLVLQKIDSSEAAVFQTAVKDCGKGEDSKEGLMKGEILEIHGILDNNQAVLDAAGKIHPAETHRLSNPAAPRPALACTECGFTFSTEKTLTHHIRYKHNKTCTVFPCPDCKQPFSNAWSVYRHLYKVHRRTTSQVRRMRYLVHSGRARNDREPERKRRKTAIDDAVATDEDRWMSNIDRDFQMCGGCGRRFERKAALHSHAQTCAKRIAASSGARTVKAPKERAARPEERPLGAARRKPALVRKLEERRTADGTREEPIAEGTVEEPIADGTMEERRTADETTAEVTITRHREDEEDGVKCALPVLPEIEIFTISDDSSDAKRSVDVSDELKEYVNDDEDLGFLAQIAAYVDREDLRCGPCGTAFMSLYVLLRHMSLHFSWFRFQCSKCSFTSFHKYDCTSHAHGRHGTPTNLMDSTVLPIPRWKVLSAAHGFRRCDGGGEAAAGMPLLEPATVAAPETIVLEDDEMPDITEEAVVLSDDERKGGEGRGAAAGPSLVSGRPVRNRTRSVKTVQNDFIYDLANVPKFDTSRGRRGRRGLGK